MNIIETPEGSYNIKLKVYGRNGKHIDWLFLPALILKQVEINIAIKFESWWQDLCMVPPPLTDVEPEELYSLLRNQGDILCEQPLTWFIRRRHLLPQIVTAFMTSDHALAASVVTEEIDIATLCRSDANAAYDYSLQRAAVTLTTLGDYTGYLLFFQEEFKWRNTYLNLVQTVGEDNVDLCIGDDVLNIGPDKPSKR